MPSPRTTLQTPRSVQPGTPLCSGDLPEAPLPVGWLGHWALVMGSALPTAWRSVSGRAWTFQPSVPRLHRSTAQEWRGTSGEQAALPQNQGQRSNQAPPIPGSSRAVWCWVLADLEMDTDYLEHSQGGDGRPPLPERGFHVAPGAAGSSRAQCRSWARAHRRGFGIKRTYCHLL